MDNIIQLTDRTAFKEGMKRCLDIDPSHTVVVTVDMQRQYLDIEIGGQPVAPDAAERVLKFSKELLDFARKCGMPVIHVFVVRLKKEIEASSGSLFYKTGRLLKLSQSTDVPEKDVPDRLEGMPQSEIPPSLLDKRDLQINTKKTMDSFLDTPLEYLIRRVIKADTVILCGINTDSCVYSTAFSTANRGFKTVVISDCVASMRGKDSHEMALELMSRSFAWVLNVEEFRKKVLEHQTK